MNIYICKTINTSVCILDRIHDVNNGSVPANLRLRCIYLISSINPICVLVFP